MKRTNYITNLIISVVLFVAILCGQVFLSAFSLPTFAEEVNKFEQSTIEEDFSNATQNGESLNLDQFSFDLTKQTQIFQFVEYCFSSNVKKQDNYGLYVYVYNPLNLQIDSTSTQNAITLSVNNVEYSKVNLKFLSRYEKENLEGLFYKFKVNFTEAQRQATLSSLTGAGRTYYISEFELFLSNEQKSTAFNVSTTYTYSGYAKGYGAGADNDSTLTCKSEGLDTISPTVHSAFYRPEGTNGKNNYTQDSLHSVYFAVPNKYIKNYGRMTAVHATWLNAVLAPALVTGNQDAFTRIHDVELGNNPASFKDENGRAESRYAYIGMYKNDHLSTADATEYKSGELHYNVPHDYDWYVQGSLNPTRFYLIADETDRIDILNLIFNAGEGVDSADNYTVSSEKLIEELAERTSALGGELVNGKYSKTLFSNVDSEYTTVNISAEESFSLTNEVLGASWWDKLWGITYTNVFDGISAIYEVKEEDFESEDNATISKNLYIDETQVDELKQFFNENKDDSTIYLFRYMVSDYTSQEATLWYETDNICTATWIPIGEPAWEIIDTNAYFFQETVNLGFDVIDITLSTGEVNTVIPVVMSPIDVIHDGTPPVYTKSDKTIDWLLILKLLLLLVLVFLLWPILWPIIKFVFKALWWIITAPFKFIGWLAGKRKKRKTKKKGAHNGTKTEKK